MAHVEFRRRCHTTHAISETVDLSLARSARFFFGSVGTLFSVVEKLSWSYAKKRVCAEAGKAGNSAFAKIARFMELQRSTFES